MNVNELIAGLQEWVERNREPELPNYDPGTSEVRVESAEGGLDSPVLEITDANGPWLIIEEPTW